MPYTAFQSYKRAVGTIGTQESVECLITRRQMINYNLKGVPHLIFGFGQPRSKALLRSQ
jgi:hypothetical protein